MGLGTQDPGQPNLQRVGKVTQKGLGPSRLLSGLRLQAKLVDNPPRQVATLQQLILRLVKIHAAAGIFLRGDILISHDPPLLAVNLHQQGPPVDGCGHEGVDKTDQHYQGRGQQHGSLPPQQNAPEVAQIDEIPFIRDRRRRRNIRIRTRRQSPLFRPGQGPPGRRGIGGDGGLIETTHNLEGYRCQGEFAKDAIEKDHGAGLHDMNRIATNQGGVADRALFDLI